MASQSVLFTKYYWGDQSRGMRWADHMGDRTDAYRDLVGGPDGANWKI